MPERVDAKADKMKTNEDHLIQLLIPLCRANSIWTHVMRVCTYGLRIKWKVPTARARPIRISGTWAIIILRDDGSRIQRFSIGERRSNATIKYCSGESIVVCLHAMSSRCENILCVSKVSRNGIHCDEQKNPLQNVFICVVVFFSFFFLFWGHWLLNWRARSASFHRWFRAKLVNGVEKPINDNHIQYIHMLPTLAQQLMWPCCRGVNTKHAKCMTVDGVYISDARASYNMEFRIYTLSMQNVISLDFNAL